MQKIQNHDKSGDTPELMAKLFTAITIGLGVALYAIAIVSTISMLQKIAFYHPMLLILPVAFFIFRAAWGIYSMVDAPFKQGYMIMAVC